MTGPLDGLRKTFAIPQPRLVTGVPVHNARRYSRDANDAALFFAQEEMVRTVPHRTLVASEIQAYVDEVLAMPWPRWREGEQWPVAVVTVPGLTPRNGTAIYKSGTMYVRQVEDEVIVLHELAHHFAPDHRAPHGAAFLAAFLDLIEHVMNPPAAGAMRECLAMEGISA